MAANITLVEPYVVDGSTVAAGQTIELPHGTAAGLVQRGIATWITAPVQAEDQFITKDQADATFHAKAEQVHIPVGTAAGAVALVLGDTDAEGLQVKVIDETISFAGNTALYKAMTTPIPAGAVILSVQANVEAALTGGSTTVKVGLGPNASDPDKYGKTSALTKNAKISTIPDWAVLSSQEAIDVCACATNGAAGDTALTVGSVRVRVAYVQAANLINAV